MPRIRIVCRRGCVIASMVVLLTVALLLVGWAAVAVSQVVSDFTVEPLAYTQLRDLPRRTDDHRVLFTSKQHIGRHIARSATVSSALYRSASTQLSRILPTHMAPNHSEPVREDDLLHDLVQAPTPAWSNLYYDGAAGSLHFVLVDPARRTAATPPPGGNTSAHAHAPPGQGGGRTPRRDTRAGPSTSRCVVERYSAQIAPMLSDRFLQKDYAVPKPDAPRGGADDQAAMHRGGFKAPPSHGMPVNIPGTRGWRFESAHVLNGQCSFVSKSSDKRSTVLIYEAVAMQSKVQVMRIYFPERRRFYPTARYLGREHGGPGVPSMVEEANPTHYSRRVLQRAPTSVEVRRILAEECGCACVEGAGAGAGEDNECCRLCPQQPASLRNLSRNAKPPPRENAPGNREGWARAIDCGPGCVEVVLQGSLPVRLAEWVDEDQCVVIGRTEMAVSFRTVCLRTFWRRDPTTGRVQPRVYYTTSDGVGVASSETTARVGVKPPASSLFTLHETVLPGSSPYCSGDGRARGRGGNDDGDDGDVGSTAEAADAACTDGAQAVTPASRRQNARARIDAATPCRVVVGVRDAYDNVVVEAFWRNASAGESAGAAEHIEGLWDTPAPAYYNDNAVLSRIQTEGLQLYGKQLKASSADGRYLVLTLIDDTLVVYDVHALLHARRNDTGGQEWQGVAASPKTQGAVKHTTIIPSAAMQGALAWMLGPPGFRTPLAAYVYGKDDAHKVNRYQRADFTHDGQYMTVITRHAVQVFKRENKQTLTEALGGLNGVLGWMDSLPLAKRGEDDQGLQFNLRWRLPREKTGAIGLGRSIDVFDATVVESDGLLFLLVLYEHGVVVSYLLDGERDTAAMYLLAGVVNVVLAMIITLVVCHLLRYDGTGRHQAFAVVVTPILLCYFVDVFVLVAQDGADEDYEDVVDVAAPVEVTHTPSPYHHRNMSIAFHTTRLLMDYYFSCPRYRSDAPSMHLLPDDLRTTLSHRQVLESRQNLGIWPDGVINKFSYLFFPFLVMTVPLFLFCVHPTDWQGQ